MLVVAATVEDAAFFQIMVSAAQTSLHLDLRIVTSAEEVAVWNWVDRFRIPTMQPVTQNLHPSAGRQTLGAATTVMLSPIWRRE